MSHPRRGKVLFIPGINPQRFDESHAAAAQRQRKARWILSGSILGGLALFGAGATLSLREDGAGIRLLPATERQTL